MNVIVIGASSGIGQRIARIYIDRGCRVGIAARKLPQLEQIRAVAQDRVFVKQIDVNADNAPDLLLSLIDEVGGADLIINVAGVGFANPPLDITKDMNIVRTNCLGFTQMVNTAYRYFANRGKGQIAAISSIAGTGGLGIAAAYSASKSYQATYLTALRQLSHGLKQNIIVTDIRPGFVDTDLLDHSRHYPMLMDADYAARKIVKAIDKHRSMAIIDWRWHLVVCLWRLIPAWLWQRLPLHRFI